MYLQIIAATILTIFVYEISAKASRGSADLPNQSEIIASFYSLKTKQKLQSPTVSMITDPARTNQSMAGIISVRLPFIGEPCGCQSLNCGCCAGMKVTQLNFDQKMCMNFTYDPLEFAIGMDMTMNDASIFMQEMSAKNPPPICMPVPTGPLPLGVEMCVKLFNIYTPGNNLHMCMDMLARIQRAPIVVLHFDCMRMGQDGGALLKPEAMYGQEGFEQPQQQQQPFPNDFYDEVTEMKL